MTQLLFCFASLTAALMVSPETAADMNQVLQSSQPTQNNGPQQLKRAGAALMW